MSERQFRLGICQLMSGVDKEENMKKAEAMVREAAAGGASVVMLPEVFQSSATSCVVKLATACSMVWVIIF